MANRCTLHKTKLEEFKSFLDSKGIAYRPGKGVYQALQVQTDQHGWQGIYVRNDMPEHYSVNDKLMLTVRRFLDENKEQKPKEIEVTRCGSCSFFRDGIGHEFSSGCNVDDRNISVLEERKILIKENYVPDDCPLKSGPVIVRLK